MASRHPSLALLTAVSLCGCAGAPSPASHPAPANIYARIPTELAGFTLTERALVRGTQADSAFRFRDTTRTNLTIIIYNLDADVRDGDLALSTVREGERFRAVQDIQKARGLIAEFAVSATDTTRIVAGP